MFKFPQTKSTANSNQINLKWNISKYSRANVKFTCIFPLLDCNVSVFPSSPHPWTLLLFDRTVVVISKLSREQAEASLAVICVGGSRVPSVPCQQGMLGKPASLDQHRRRHRHRHLPSPPPSLTPRERIMRMRRGCTTRHGALFPSRCCRTDTGPQLVARDRSNRRQFLKMQISYLTYVSASATLMAGLVPFRNLVELTL